MPQISEKTAAGLIELFGVNSDLGTADGFTCSEAEMIASMLREELGADEAARWFLTAHAETDEPDDEHYQPKTAQEITAAKAAERDRLKAAGHHPVPPWLGP